MQNPKKANLQTTEQVRLAGWAGESRDADGHLIRTHANFTQESDIIWFVTEAMAHGEVVTIWSTDLEPETA